MFKVRRGPFSKPGRWSELPRDFATFATRLRGSANDLTEAAISVTPAIRDLLVAVAALPGCVLTRLTSLPSALISPARPAAGA